MQQANNSFGLVLLIYIFMHFLNAKVPLKTKKIEEFVDR